MSKVRNGEVVANENRVTVLLKEDGKVVISVPAESVDDANEIVQNWSSGSYGMLTEGI